MRSVVLSLFVSVAAVIADTGMAFFEKRIRPVLVAHCHECHSADAVKKGKVKGGLQLDSRDGIRAGGDTGPAVVPGNSGASLILSALRQEKNHQMPPKGKLPDAVIADFQRWIEMGAPVVGPRDLAQSK